MSTTHDARWLAIRSIAAVVACYDAVCSPSATDVMLRAVHNLGAEALRLGLTSEAIVNEILHPVKAAIDTRYGAEVGHWIYADFVRAFEEAVVLAN